MSRQNIKKYYKFPIGGIVALVAGASMAICASLAYFVTTLSNAFNFLMYLSRFDSFIDDYIDSFFDSFTYLLNFVESTISFTPTILSAASFVLLGILLLTKQRKSLLLIPPIISIAGILSYFSPLIFIIAIRTIDRSISTLGYLSYIINILGYFIILAAYVLFFAFVLITYREKERSSSVMAWVAGGIIASGYGFFIVGSCTLSLCYQLIYDFGSLVPNLIYLLFSWIASIFSVNTAAMLVLPAVFVLAGLWIANPYKKGVIIDGESIKKLAPPQAPEQKVRPQIEETRERAPAYTHAQAPMQSPPPASQPNLEHKIYALKKYKELLELGLISQEDFDKKKTELIDFIDS